MKNTRLTRHILLAILAAWAVVFRMLNFQLLPTAPFLKFDFSDIPVFIGLLVNGPIGAAAVALIRDLIEYLRKGGEAGIPLGVSMSFIGTMTMMGVMHLSLKGRRADWSIKQIVLTSLSVMVSLTVVMTLINKYVALPIYITVINWPIPNVADYLLVTIIPFNLLKGLILSVLMYLVYRQFRTYMAKRALLYTDYQS